MPLMRNNSSILKLISISKVMRIAIHTWYTTRSSGCAVGTVTHRTSATAADSLLLLTFIAIELMEDFTLNDLKVGKFIMVRSTISADCTYVSRTT